MLHNKTSKRIISLYIRRPSKVTDVIPKIDSLKWKWTVYIGRMIDNLWTKHIVEWRPREEEADLNPDGMMTSESCRDAKK